MKTEKTSEAISSSNNYKNDPFALATAEKSAFFSAGNFFGGGNFFRPIQKKNIGQEGMQASEKEGDQPKDILSEMGESFGEDFTNVKINTSSQQATDIGALAYTQGNEISFAAGQYRPEIAKGRELLGHELTHVVQQRQGRVLPTAQAKGMAINNDKELEEEADNMGKTVSQPKAAPTSLFQTSNTVETPSTPIQKKAEVAQFALPAILAGMEAAEWIALGATGYVVGNDAINSTSGDIAYTFDEMEGVLLAGGGTDIAAYRQQHPNTTITEATHRLAVWFGIRGGSRKMGIKFGITFLYDGFSLGNISCSIIDTFDWPSWGGNVNVNITPRSLAQGVASVRFTINMGTSNSWFNPDHTGNAIFLLRGDGDLSLLSNNHVWHQIGD